MHQSLESHQTASSSSHFEIEKRSVYSDDAPIKPIKHIDCPWQTVPSPAFSEYMITVDGDLMRFHRDIPNYQIMSLEHILV